MRKHISLWMLAVRSTVYKALGLLVLMGTAQALAFWLSFRQSGDPGFETILVQSRIELICGAFFLLYCALLCIVGCDRHGAKSGYTLSRLSVSEQSVMFWFALSGCLFLLIFWAAELGVIFLLARLYETLMGADRLGGQGLFLAFYRNDFLHSLLPLGDWSRYLRNILLIVSLGFCAACFGCRQRRGQKAFAMSLMAGITAVFFSWEMGRFGSDIFLSLMALVIGGTAVLELRGGASHEA